MNLLNWDGKGDPAQLLPPRNGPTTQPPGGAALGDADAGDADPGDADPGRIKPRP